jgi:GntR family transcriptional regulator/MocR family aminotransferase
VSAKIHASLELDLHLVLGETRPARALERSLRDAIVAGRAPAGHRLPPTRSLAADLGIARTAVSEVYAQLTAEGWLEARVGAGTWVAETAAALPERPGPRHVAAVDDRTPGPGLILAYGGCSDPSLFPRREWLLATRRAVGSATAAELSSLDGRGAQRLRQQLAVYLRRTRGACQRRHDVDRPWFRRTARAGLPGPGGRRCAAAGG